MSIQTFFQMVHKMPPENEADNQVILKWLLSKSFRLDTFPNIPIIFYIRRIKKMNDNNYTNIDTVVDNAIKERLGDINGLPDSARQKIRQDYRVFFEAYLKIADLKKTSQHINTEKRDAAGFDPDIIEYMQHFFSDYQNIYRDFKSANRHARALIQIDRNKHPQDFESQLNALISGKNDFTEESVMEEILT